MQMEGDGNREADGDDGGQEEEEEEEEGVEQDNAQGGSKEVADPTQHGYGGGGSRARGLQVDCVEGVCTLKATCVVGDKVTHQLRLLGGRQLDKFWTSLRL